MCWNIHGKRPGWKQNRGRASDRQGKALKASTPFENNVTTESNPFTKEQLDLL